MPSSPEPSPADLLRSALALIPDAEHWTRWTPKEVVEGRTCYCAMGALNMVTAGTPWGGEASGLGRAERDALMDGAYGIAVDALDEATGNRSPTSRRGTAMVARNNYGNYEDVREMFERAIALVEKEATHV